MIWKGDSFILWIFYKTHVFRISERQQHLSASLNGSSDLKDTISYNQTNSGKLVDQLTKLQMDEKVIKSEDMIKGLEFALSNMRVSMYFAKIIFILNECI